MGYRKDTSCSLHEFAKSTFVECGIWLGNIENFLFCVSHITKIIKYILSPRWPVKYYITAYAFTETTVTLRHNKYPIYQKVLINVYTWSRGLPKNCSVNITNSTCKFPCHKKNNVRSLPEILQWNLIFFVQHSPHHQNLTGSQRQTIKLDERKKKPFSSFHAGQSKLQRLYFKINLKQTSQ